MTTEELLEHLRVNILRDEAVPPLWSDEELLAYLDDAQRIMARFTHCLVSTTGGASQITTAAGVSAYPLHPAVLHVSAVYCEETRRELSPAAYAPFAAGHGAPQAYRASIDNAGELLVFPVPDNTYTLRLRVARDPLESMAKGGEPEVPVQWRLALVDWAAYRALRANDPEQLNMAAANDLNTQWRLSLRDMKRDIYQLNTGPHPRATVNWTLKGR